MAQEDAAKRIEEAKQELHRIINDREMKDCLLLVFANKQDMEDCEHPVPSIRLSYSLPSSIHMSLPLLANTTVSPTQP